MKKILVGLFTSIFLILSGGGINYHFSLPVDTFLLVVGIVILLATIAAAIIMRQELRQSFTLPMIVLSTIVFGALDVSAETIHSGVLTPPDKWPILQWNPNAVSGLEFWGYFVVLVVMALALCGYLLYRLWRATCITAPRHLWRDDAQR